MPVSRPTIYSLPGLGGSSFSSFSYANAALLGDADTNTPGTALYTDTNVGLYTTAPTWGIEASGFTPSLTGALYPNRICTVVFDVTGTISITSGTFQLVISTGASASAGSTGTLTMASILNSATFAKTTYQFGITSATAATGSLFVPISARLSRVGGGANASASITLRVYEVFFSAAEPGGGVDILEHF